MRTFSKKIVQFISGSEELVSLGKLLKYVDKQRYAKFSHFAGSISDDSSVVSKV